MTVEVYERGDCSPPQLEDHGFERPVCVATLASEQWVVMGQKTKVPEAGRFRGDLEVRVPRGSVLVFTGNSADVVQRSVPSVTGRFVTVTLRVAREDASRRQ